MTSAILYIVTPDYSGVMQVPLRRGRFFTDHDNLASPPVVVIDEVLARRVFPGQDPVGREISLIVLGSFRIVGVVGHVKQWGLDSDDNAKIRDQIYFPAWQIPDKFMSEGVAGLTLTLRTRVEPLSLISAVRAQVAGPTRDQPIYAVQTMEQIISRSLAERRFTMLMLIIFAATALLLAAVGIYGVRLGSFPRRDRRPRPAPRDEAGRDRNGGGSGCGPGAHAVHGGLVVRRAPGRSGDPGCGDTAAGSHCAAGVLHPRAPGHRHRPRRSPAVRVSFTLEKMAVATVVAAWRRS